MFDEEANRHRTGTRKKRCNANFSRTCTSRKNSMSYSRKASTRFVGGRSASRWSRAWQGLARLWTKFNNHLIWFACTNLLPTLLCWIKVFEWPDLEGRTCQASTFCRRPRRNRGCRLMSGWRRDIVCKSMMVLVLVWMRLGRDCLRYPYKKFNSSIHGLNNVIALTSIHTSIWTEPLALLES